MSQLMIPTSARGQCPHCRQAVLIADLPSKTEGKPATVWLDPEPDSSGRYLVSPPRRKGARWQAGPLRPNQAAAARSYGQELHSDHTNTCVKRSGSKR